MSLLKTEQSAGPCPDSPGLWLALRLAMSAVAVYTAAHLAFRGWDGVSTRFSGVPSYIQIPAAFVFGGYPLSNEQPPFYPLVQAALMKAVGWPDYRLAAVAFQAVLAFLVLLGVGSLVVRNGGSRRSAAIATALVCANQSYLQECLATRETGVFSAIVLASAWFWSSMMDSRRPGGILTSVLLGFLAAAGWLTRPAGVVLALVSGCVVSWYAAEQGPRRLLGLFCGYVMAMVLPLTLWLGYQVQTNQLASVAGTSNAISLFRGNNPALVSIYPYVDVGELDRHILAREALARTKGIDPDTALRAAALDFVRENPLECLQLVPRKLMAFYMPLDFPLGEGRIRHAGRERWSIASFQPKSWRTHLLGLAALPGVFFLYLAIRAPRRMPPFVVASATLVILVSLLHVVTYAETRSRLPFDPLLAVGMCQVTAVINLRRPV